MKDDSGSYAAFTEQGSSASQMTAAKVMDDAVSAYTQVRMEDAPRFLRIPKSEYPYRCMDTSQWPKSRSSIEDSLVPLERHFYGHPLTGVLWERQFKKVLLGLGWEKSTESGISFCSSQTRIVLVGVRG